jgi:predicted ester cyclase
VGNLSTAELRGFYAEYVAAWNRRDMEHYYSLYSENLVFQDGIEVLHGVVALRERYESELAAFPDLTIECKRLLVDEGTQTLAAENLERGTHSGDLVVGGERLSPTGRRLRLHDRDRPYGEVTYVEVDFTHQNLLERLTPARSPAAARRGAR